MYAMHLTVPREEEGEVPKISLDYVYLAEKEGDPDTLHVNYGNSNMV